MFVTLSKILCVFALVACAHSRAVDRATLVSSTLTIACDYGQTMYHARQGWPNGREELNPIMGPTPSTAVVTTYFVSAAVVNAVAPYVLPAWARSVVRGAVTARQAVAIEHNMQVGTPMCGL